MAPATICGTGDTHHESGFFDKKPETLKERVWEKEFALSYARGALAHPLVSARGSGWCELFQMSRANT